MYTADLPRDALTELYVHVICYPNDVTSGRSRLNIGEMLPEIYSGLVCIINKTYWSRPDNNQTVQRQVKKNAIGSAPKTILDPT